MRQWGAGRVPWRGRECRVPQSRLVMGVMTQGCTSSREYGIVGSDVRERTIFRVRKAFHLLETSDNDKRKGGSLHPTAVFYPALEVGQ